MNNKSSSLITPGDQPLSSLWQKKPALPIEALHFEPTAEPVGTAEGELKMDVKQHVRAWCPSRVGPAGRTRQHTPASLLGKKKWGPLFGARSAGALAAQGPVLLDDQNRLTRNTVQHMRLPPDASMESMHICAAAARPCTWQRQPGLAQQSLGVPGTGGARACGFSAFTSMRPCWSGRTCASCARSGPAGCASPTGSRPRCSTFPARNRVTTSQ